MEKLTRLINEYGKTNWCGPFETYRVEPTSSYYYTSYLVLQWDDNGEGDWKDWHLPIPTLISKDYGFIKWLVENDKIDGNKYDEWLDKEGVDMEYPALEKLPHKEAISMVMIMLLAIQDNPIEFLIKLIQ